jgi:cytidine deaminase
MSNHPADADLSPDLIKGLLEAAGEARKHAYAPYSKFAVGAAVLTERGEVFTGCNIENASYGGTMCAERVAIFKAISAGYKTIQVVAVIANHPTPVPSCGICRQVIAEFGGDAVVLMANTQGLIEITSMQELLPYSFHLQKP